MICRLDRVIKVAHHNKTPSGAKFNACSFRESKCVFDSATRPQPSPPVGIAHCSSGLCTYTWVMRHRPSQILVPLSLFAIFPPFVDRHHRTDRAGANIYHRRVGSVSQLVARVIPINSFASRTGDRGFTNCQGQHELDARCKPFFFSSLFAQCGWQKFCTTEFKIAL